MILGIIIGLFIGFVFGFFLYCLLVHADDKEDV